MLDAIFSLEAIYVLSGLVLVVIGASTFRDSTHPARIRSGLFWTLLGVVFALGSVLPAWLTGVLVIAMAAVDATGGVRSGEHHEPSHDEKSRSADRFGAWLFAPVLMIPVLTYLSLAVFSRLTTDINRVVYVGLGYASVVAGLAAYALTRARPAMIVSEGRRLAEAIGAVVILPQLLAALGSVFKAAGVSEVIAGMVASVAPTGSVLALAVIACVSVAMLTFVLGNSFGAFPLIMTGVGIPLLVTPYGASPAAVGLILLTAASCGTLCTPMAANFNMVPSHLLEMKNEYGVIRFQAPFAAVMLVVHIALLWAVLTFVG